MGQREVLTVHAFFRPVMIKQRIMLTEIPEVKYICYMRSHNSGNIHGENLHI